MLVDWVLSNCIATLSEAAYSEAVLYLYSDATWTTDQGMILDGGFTVP